MRPAAKKDSIKFPKAVSDLVDSVGAFIEYWGFKAIEGKIWCVLFLSQTPLDATQVMGRLGISKGLVSISVKRLLKYGVIQEAGKSDYGTQLYQSSPDLVEVILGVLRIREKTLLETVFSRCESSQQINKKTLENARIRPEQIENLKEFTDQALILLNSLVESKSGDLEFLFNPDSVIEPEIRKKIKINQSKNRSASSDEGNLH